jgi:hypothetical protein
MHRPLDTTSTLFDYSDGGSRIWDFVVKIPKALGYKVSFIGESRAMISKYQEFIKIRL